jgi:16S rRNA (adenine1518-N6/adenine1519-N6)-dimethyltransferase
MSSPRGLKPETLFSERYLKSVLHLDPKEKIGQNFLIDPETAEFIASKTIPGADVVEIGSGPGNLTRRIAQKGAGRVIGLEIDPGFALPQKRVLNGMSNVEVHQQNALSFKYEQWLRSDPDAQHQVIGNIPYHISEPLITQLAVLGRHLDDITLLVGDKLALTLTTGNPRSADYSKLSFIAGVFDVKVERVVPSTSFWPQPRTESAVVKMTPREMADGESQTAFGLKRAIVESSGKNLTLAKVINNFNFGAGLDSGKFLDKSNSHKYDRRQTHRDLRALTDDLNDMPQSRKDREKVQALIASRNKSVTRGLADRLGLPAQMLSKPFSGLNSEEVKQLAQALKEL